MATFAQVRPGAYYDSIVLMQLQRALAALPGVEGAGVVMGSAANKEILAQSGLLNGDAHKAGADDLIIAVRAAGDDEAQAALAQVDALLARRSTAGEEGSDYRPRTLAGAAQQLAAARWVLVSTPGRYAAGVAREALALGRNVFLYSDNVSLEDEIALKREASARGLLVMGPDCGTAIVNGIGLGFANRVRRGRIGLIGASGTGLQLVTSRIHQLGGGITHALGTGGRDLSDGVGGLTTLQALDLLRRDPDTAVIVLISKPPSERVAVEVLRAAHSCGKPVIIDFIGHQPAQEQRGNVTLAPTLESAATLAVELALFLADEPPPAERTARGCLRGLFSGGTLAYEAQLLLRDRLPEVWSNAPLEKRLRLESGLTSRGHTIVDLGEDEFTVGRLHPMLDNELRIKRLLQEAADPETGVLLLDVVLGDGAHPDPASELAPAIEQARARAAEAGRTLPVLVILVGTDADPQGLDSQAERLRAAGADVHLHVENAIDALLPLVSAATAGVPVPPEVLSDPFAALNIGLESFAASLTEQGAPVVQVEWRPPAGGNERLAGILSRMKARP